ncbi:hypothetical protein QFC22_005277 [Naganishia vaughanmartiniae]|uniref:Uncharacterized protein n=1 Tax=Naganishia vaughanmartiniae TaxID=1424756 RepID=A0ACC2WYE0_9TREE|nr:hypothetical protein QFC22_005277 [Naganishia vaughanmartiniae]
MDVPPSLPLPLPETGFRNPIIALAAALIRAILYLLNVVRLLVAFVTISIPTYVVRILGYSLTLRLDFTKLLILFALAGLGVFVWVRYRYLNKYSELKEVPWVVFSSLVVASLVVYVWTESDWLALENSPPSLPTSLAPPDPHLLNPLLSLPDEFSRPSAFHNYLDEFLSAIRVFGFLEKPVFHELSRHLQTKRLMAGETITISLDGADGADGCGGAAGGGGDKNFYCVLDGNVQVFTNSGHASGMLDTSRPVEGLDGSYNGYQLLNEVSTGGTLSSLFTILSLFTEDVKLSWEGEQEYSSADGGARGEMYDDMSEDDQSGESMRNTFDDNDDDDQDDDDEDDEDEINDAESGSVTTEIPRTRKKQGRSDSDVSQLDFASMGTTTTTTASSSSASNDADAVGGGDGMRELEASSLDASSLSLGMRGKASIRDSQAQGDRDRRKGKGTSPSIPAVARRTRSPRTGKSSTTPSRSNIPHQTTPSDHPHPHSHPRPSRVIARATVDTTLAVIPSHAFKRLRLKFPKATGQIVSVILTRFARVTFMTAHRYLGLTKEVLQAEDKLNALVSYPLPIGFYERGGMDGLRSRFMPEAKAAAAADEERRRGNEGGDYTGATARYPSTTTADRPASEKDYFSFAPPDSPTTRHSSAAGSRPSSAGSMKSTMHSVTPRDERTPSAAIASMRTTGNISPSTVREKGKKHQGLGMTKLDSPVPVGAASSSRPITDTRETFRRGTSRKQVGAGDLMSMTSNNASNEGPLYRPGPQSARTPGLKRMDTWLEKPSFGQSMSTLGLKRSSDFGVNSLGDLPKRQQEALGDDFDLRDAVMVSIAESIGLIQSSSPESTAPSGTESQGHSTPNSPLFGGVGGSVSGAGAHSRNQSRSPFGNLSMLDMLQGNNNSALHFKDRMTADDESSVTGTTTSASGRLGDLENDVQILYFKAGSKLVGEGETNPGLFFVIDGFLDVSIARSGTESATLSVDPVPAMMNEKQNRNDEKTGEKPKPAQDYLFTVKPGGIAGYLASLCGTPSYTNVTAKTDCYVGLLPHTSFERLLERRPIVLLTLAKRLISLLSPLVHDLDLALDWEQINAGQVLYREGDKSDSFYIVINGRLRSVHEHASGKVDLIAEYGQGSPIGELEAITDSARPNTVHAIRDSELVKMPMTLFNAVSVQHPATTIRFLRLIASRVKQAAGPSLRQNPVAKPYAGSSGANLNLKTVCILPVTGSVPIAAFAERLRNALEDIGAPTAYLNQASVMRQLGRHAFSKMGKLKIAGWLAEREQRNRTVLYVVDTPVTSQWTLTSIRQADFVLIVGMGDDVALGEYEKLLLATKTTARKELVLLHPERYVASGFTRRWLKDRSHISGHHHVELPGIVLPNKTPMLVHDPAAIAAFKHLREKVETRIKKYRFRPSDRPRRPPHMNDFARLARRLCGKSIGLVLGGGGGRGISHIGMLQALEEAQIPVDAIGGCSIGAFVGGLYAREADLLSTRGRAKQFSGRMGSLWRLLSDVTYPFAAYTTGHEFNRGIYKAFYDVHLEDMWIPFFANSTNITHSRMEIHKTGYAWRYVRASMTLAGLLPPISDRGDLLVDGGYIDNLPVSVMMSMGPTDVIAIDVGSIDDTSPRNYGDSVSGWGILLNKYVHTLPYLVYDAYIVHRRMNPFAKQQVLSMAEVSGRLT